jgi:hypothetical protein
MIPLEIHRICKSGGLLLRYCILVLGLNHESAQFLISEQRHVLGPHIGPTRPQDRLFSLTLSNPLVIKTGSTLELFCV